MNHERDRMLYGDAAGHWAILESAEGWIPPPRIGDLRMLTNVGSAALKIYNAIPGAGMTGRAARAGYPAQAMIAKLAGVGQQAVSRYVRGETSSDLPDEGWQRVTALLYAWTEWPDKPCDHAAVEAFLRTGEEIRAQVLAGPVLYGVSARRQAGGGRDT